MNFEEEYLKWIQSSSLSKIERIALKLLKNDKKLLEDSFYKNLDFGTGGLRGLMGLGSNRINRFTVRKATQGIANYLLGIINLPSFSVAIAYDTRNNSKEYAFEALSVFSSNGIKSYIFENTMPTPILSYAVRTLNCACGIVITASHNPKEYNGYKVYGSDGAQIGLNFAKNLTDQIFKVDAFKVNVDNIKKSIEKRLIEFIDVSVLNEYYNNVTSLSLLKGEKDLSIVYTPIHGSGLNSVNTVLKKLGYKIFLVPEQSNENGNFPTVVSPNPEEKSTFALAIQYAINIDADIILGTDPDADRVGLVVKDKNEFIFFDGNQIGAIIIDYILKHKVLNGNEAIIKTIVTSDLGSKIGEKYGVKIFNTLTGFKFIGEKINEFNALKEYEFLFGYEESFGFLMGTFVRDKDAVISSMLITDAAQYHKRCGRTLVDALNDIENEFGYYSTELQTFTFNGLDGQRKMNQVMILLRDSKFLCQRFNNISSIEDYLTSTRFFTDGKIETILLPKSNVIKFYLSEKTWVAVRPSGTEPKLKVYFSAFAEKRNDSEKLLNDLKKDINTILTNFI